MRALAVAALMTVVMTAAHAEATQQATTLNDDQVRRIVALALENITRARCADAKPCAAATDEERANPPLTIVEARAIILRGILSAAGQRCGLDWEKQNFVPMMAYWRQQQKKSPRQMALVALLHGIMQGIASPKDPEPCTDQMRRNLEPRLVFRP
jgi:hypothetical protein